MKKNHTAIIILSVLIFHNGCVYNARFKGPHTLESDYTILTQKKISGSPDIKRIGIIRAIDTKAGEIIISRETELSIGDVLTCNAGDETVVLKVFYRMTTLYKCTAEGESVLLDKLRITSDVYIKTPSGQN